MLLMSPPLPSRPVPAYPEYDVLDDHTFVGRVPSEGLRANMLVESARAPGGIGMDVGGCVSPEVGDVIGGCVSFCVCRGVTFSAGT